MSLDINTVRFSPHALKEVATLGDNGEFGRSQTVEFRDYPRLTYRWDSFRGKAIEQFGCAERVVWLCDGIECPDFDTAIARMENETAAEGRDRG